MNEISVLRVTGGVCLVAGLLASGAPTLAADTFPVAAGRYAIRSNMVMPHLDEMRRITAEETRCVPQDGATALFPVLRQPALRGCTFGFGARRASGFQYVLVCETARVATGTAELEQRGDTVVGQLSVKMGGKNMTFAQGIHARYETAAAADCTAP